MIKKRADLVLLEKNLVESREKAKRLIMEGRVFIGERRVDKAGEKIDINSHIYIKDNPYIYVSRGGLKLEKAIEDFKIDLNNKTCMDIGASTGGFTDCMLRNGCKKVYAIDVGYGQLDWKLRNNEKVIVMERTNIRYVNKEDIKDEIDFFSIDVSFISLKLVLPVCKKLITKDGQVVALIKPQFEAGKDKVGKKGLVKDKMTHFSVIKEIVDFSRDQNFAIKNLSYSPITGATGNIEFLIYLSNTFRDDGNIDETYIKKIINKSHENLN